MKAGYSQVKLVRAEWDFTSVPEAEAGACLQYEMAREITNLDEYLHGIGFRTGPPSEMLHPTSENRNLFIANFLGSNPFMGVRWMPNDAFDRPWLKLPSEHRSQIAAGFEECTSGLRRLRVGEYIEPEVLPPGHWMSEEKQVAFSVDWRHSNTRLVEYFRKWVEKNRPEDVDPVIERGRKSPRDGLNALSALRLVHSLPWLLGARLYLNLTGLHLFGDRTFFWKRARARAVEYFVEQYLGAEGPASIDAVELVREEFLVEVTLEDFDNQIREFTLSNL